jgi:aldose 1-epimerase
MQLSSQLFGTTKDGIEVTQYTITNPSGAYISVLTLGGIIREIVVPDSQGTFKNVALGYDRVEHYEQDTAYLGAAIGRSAGRISKASFVIDDVTYPLAKNNGENNLHGGPNGFHSRVWDASEFITADRISLVLNYRSPDLEEGFPGELDSTITYTFNTENELTIKYICTTDKKTFVNLTNHCYFNLSGDFTATHYSHMNKEASPRFAEGKLFAVGKFP